MRVARDYDGLACELGHSASCKRRKSSRSVAKRFELMI
jgi:hypothetical protein